MPGVEFCQFIKKQRHVSAVANKPARGNRAVNSLMITVIK